MNCFPIWKRTATHADVLAAVGLADLLASGDVRCSIREEATRFLVESETAVTPAEVSRMGRDPGYSYLQTKTAPLPATILPSKVLNYEEQKERFTRAKAQPKGVGTEILEEIASQNPVSDWRLYQALNALQGDGGTNRVAEFLSAQGIEDWSTTLHQCLRELSESRSSEPGFAVDLVQLFNPQAAKGYARLKPDSTGRGDKTKDSWAEPFLEWLRFRGYFQAGSPYFVGPKSEHVRLLCPIPKNIRYSYYRRVVEDWRGLVIFGSAPKIDCLATLELARLLIQRSEEFQPGGRRRPAESIAAVSITHYQSMGNAKAITGIEHLVIPGWFRLETREDAEFWLATLQEHYRAIRLLTDKNSDEIGMILEYRRFLEHRGRPAFRHLLEFIEIYGIFVLRKRAQNQWRHRQFTVKPLEEILSNELDYTAILRNPGFQAIAGALRSATVSAQSLKRNKRDYREIRYDILPDLRRKRSISAAAFLETVTEFVSEYNAESARRLEIGKTSGIKRVATDDLESFVSLFDGSKTDTLIGALLCAYATCRETQEPAEPAESTSEEAPNAEA